MGHEIRVAPDKLAIAAQRNVKERVYWLNQLAGNLEKSHFPYDFKKESSRESMMEKVRFRLPQALFLKAGQLTGGVDIKLHMLMVTGLVILLNKYSCPGNNDIIIGSSILKQEQEGNFINTLLILRNRVEPGINFKNLLLQVRETIIAASENQNYPIEILLGQLNPPLETSAHECPLWEVILLWENLHDRRYIKGYHYNMLFSFSNSGESIDGVVEYNSLLYRESTVTGITRHFIHILDQALADVNRQIPGIEMLAEEEKQVLFDLNRKEPQYSKYNTILEIFADQVEKSPNKNVCIEKERSITFKELDHQSDVLAEIIKGI